MRNWPVESNIILLWKQVVYIYHESVGLSLNLFVGVSVSLIEWGGWWTACHPVGTMTTVSLWSLLAAVLPNGIFLEITASKCDMPLVFIFIVDEVCVWGLFVIKPRGLCVRVREREIKCGGVLSWGAKRTCSIVTRGWLEHDRTLPGRLYQERGWWGCLDVGSGICHAADCFISHISNNNQTAAKDLG